MIFIIFKKPQDLFKLFSIRPDVKFSIFQYPNFFYAEQKFKILKNT